MLRRELPCSSTCNINDFTIILNGKLTRSSAAAVRDRQMEDNSQQRSRHTHRQPACKGIGSSTKPSSLDTFTE